MTCVSPTLCFTLPDRDVDVECKIIIDTLTDESAGLSRERHEALARARMEDPEVNAPSVPWETRVRRLRSDPYFNALQVKYAYAMTCHKAQVRSGAMFSLTSAAFRPSSRAWISIVGSTRQQHAQPLISTISTPAKWLNEATLPRGAISTAWIFAKD